MESKSSPFRHWILSGFRHHLVSYRYFQVEDIAIGLGTIESAAKQIGALIDLLRSTLKSRKHAASAAHQCAYLNEQFSNWDSQDWNVWRSPLRLRRWDLRRVWRLCSSPVLTSRATAISKYLGSGSSGMPRSSIDPYHRVINCSVSIKRDDRST